MPSPSSSSPSPSSTDERGDRQGECVADELDALHGLLAVATAVLVLVRVGSIADNRVGGWYSYRRPRPL